jgi:hypothetical protein
MLTVHAASHTGCARQVYVAHLDQRAGEEDIRAMFAPFGPVLNVRIIVDRETGASKGYGFVTMAAPAMAQVGRRPIFRGFVWGFLQGGPPLFCAPPLF